MILAIQVSSGFHVNQETFLFVNLMKQMIICQSAVEALCFFQMPIARVNHCANRIRNQTERKGVIPGEQAGQISKILINQVELEITNTISFIMGTTDATDWRFTIQMVQNIRM